MSSTIINKDKVFLLVESFKDSFINISEYTKWANEILAKVDLSNKGNSIDINYNKDFRLRDRTVNELGNILKISNKNILIDEPTHQTLVLKLKPIDGSKEHKPSVLTPIYRDIIKFRIKHDDLSGYNVPSCRIYEYKDHSDFALDKVFTYCLKNGYDSIFVDKYIIIGIYGGIHKLFGSMMNGIKLYYYDNDKLVEVNITKEVVA